MTRRVRLGIGVLLLPLLMSCSFGSGREKDLADQIRGVGSVMVSRVVYRPEDLRLGGSKYSVGCHASSA